MPRVRMCAADRKKYPGGDAEGWVDFDVELLVSQTAGWLEEFEEATGYTVSEFLQAVEAGRAKAIRALLWAARRLAGCQDPWEQFQPQILLVQHDDGADADPPAPANRAARRASRSRAASKT